MSQPLDEKELKRAILRVPDSFQFPFRPYEIQTQFMEKLYESIEAGGLGIFESPTGTVRYS